MTKTERELRLRITALRGALSRVRGDFRDDALCAETSFCKHCIAREALEEDERAALTAASEVKRFVNGAQVLRHYGAARERREEGA